MSKQNHSNKNVTTVVFLLLVVSIGFPFQSLPILDIDVNVNGNDILESPFMPFAHAVNGSAPVITVSNLTSTEYYQDEYIEYGVTISDAEDGDITDQLIFNFTDFTNNIGENTIYYEVTDSDSNFVQANRTVTIIEKPPVISNSTSTVFTNAIYQSQDDADPINDIVMGRSESSEVTQVGERKFVTSSGLTRWLNDTNGNYVERLVTDDVNGVKFESGIFSYYYDKNQCGMTIHDIGKINEDNESFIKYNGWVVKSALNGTDTWTDLEQNNLDCVVTVIDNFESTKIISVRENSNGKFTETYEVPKPISEMKTTLDFFNNNTAINNHKIAFSNVLDTTPEHFRFLLAVEDIADEYPEDMEDPIEYPKLKGFTTSPATVPIQYSNNCNIPVNSTLFDRLDDCTTVIPNGGFIDIPRDDFYVTMYVNATDYPIGILTDNGFAMDYYSEDKQKWIPVRYEFTNDAMDNLWNVRIVNNQPTENRVFIDYMNTQEITAVGQTVSLDPHITTPLSEVAIQGLTNNSGTFFGAGSACRNTPQLAFTNNFAWSHGTVGGMIGGAYNICTVPVLTFDMATVPDDGSVLQMDFSYDVDSEAMANVANHRNLWFMGTAEDIRGFDGTDAGLTIYESDHEPSPFPENIQYGSFTSQNLSTCGGIFPCTLAYTAVDPHTITDQIELRLESGIDWIIFSGCNWFNGASSPNTSNGCGVRYASSTALNNSWQGDEATILLEITWEIFTPTSAPNNLTCTVVGSDLFLDFEPPTNLGGTTLTGYEIDRSSGFSFQNIAIVGVTPSEYLDDSGVLTGISYTYRVYPTNDLGRGAFAEISCGLAGLPTDPFGLTATSISLGVVALDWNEPSFTGNTILTGYQIDRTTGTPSTSDDWTYVQHNRKIGAFSPDGSDVSGAGIRLVSIGDSVGQSRLFGVTDSTVEGIFLSTHGSSGGANVCTHDHYGYPDCTGNSYIFKDFDKEELKEREITWRWDQFRQQAGFSLQSFGEWETRAFIVDGIYDITGANTLASTGDFISQVIGTNVEKIHIPSVGNGIIQDCFDTTSGNVVVNLGGNPIVATPPNTSQMEALNQHEVSCTVDSALLDSQSSEDRVTVVFMLYDDQAGSNGCGSNCASTGAGSVVMDYIDITGMGNWVFQNDLPLDTDINLISSGLPTPEQVTLDLNPVLNISTQNFTIGDGFNILVADTGNTLTEYLDNTVEELTTYGYRVLAINSEGIGDPSNTAIVETAGSPSAPNPVATATGTQAINLSWAIPDLNGGIVVEYEIERKTGTSGIYQFLDTTTDISYDDGAGLFTIQSATEYCYRVLVTTNVGSSDFSSDTCATTFDAPSAPLNLQVTALDGSSVDMSFDTPASDGGSPITGYKVERQIGVGGFVTLDTSTLIQFRNDTGLPIGTLITYKVSASNQFGLGTSTSGSDTTDATPQVPQNFVCSASTPDSINLSWDTPVTFSPPTGYQVSRNIDGGAYSVIVADTASTGTTYNDGSLSLDTIYGYKILAHTPEGDTLLTDEVLCQTLKQPDAPPENFKADFSLLAPHTVTLTWDTPNTFGVPITSITVERDDGAGYNVLTVLQSNAVGMIDNNPDNDVDQKYRIKLTGELGDSKYGFAIQSTLDRISHFNFEKSIFDSGDQKNSATVSGIVNFTETGHAGTSGFEYDGASYITVDVAQESDYDFDRLSEFGTTLYYEGTDATGQQALVTKGSTLSSIGWFLYLDNGIPTFRMNGATQSLEVQSTANVTDGSLHFVGFTSTNGTASGVEMMVDGVTTAKNVITDTLSSESILNNIALTFGATATGTNILQSITDEISIFGDTLDEDELENLSLDQIETIAPIVATMTLTGSTFADVSGEQGTITLQSGYPLPTIDGVIQLLNYSATTVNTLPSQVIPASGVLILPTMFNTMGSTSNYTTIVTLNNGLEVFLVLSNEDIQNPLFSLPDGIDFFFQHARDPTFSVLSFNFTRTSIPFDLHCNLKSELFADGVTHPYGSVGFIQALWNVPPTKDVVVACIDPNSPLLNPDEPSFGGSNALLTFVSFGDTSGIGAFLNFTDNYGDFFGAPVPFLFIILVAALFTGRSAPTGIIIVGITIGIMWYLGILVIDPILWGVIIVLVILGAIGGKKFL